MRYIFDGTRIVLRTPRLWKFIVQPLIVGALISFGVWLLSIWLIVPRVTSWIATQTSGPLSVALQWFAAGLFILLLVLTSGFLYLTVVSFLSGSLWEKLSFEVELLTTGQRVEAKLPIGTLVGDGVARGLFAIAISLLSMCCGWVLFGIPAIFLAGYLGLHDYTSAAFLRRGVVFGEQRRQLSRLPNRGGFLIGSGILTLLPVVNVLMLPALVAAGTLMVIDSERASAYHHPSDR